MNVAILGGTGFIGKRLIQRLLEKGYSVYLFARKSSPYMNHSERLTILPWPSIGKSLKEPIKVDAVINLAGETINQRWTVEAKKSILTSRIETTKQWVQLISDHTILTDTFISGSAVGFYGFKESKLWNERDQVGVSDGDFLASVTHAWEKEAEKVEALGVRCVRARLGVVLGEDGGAFPKMLAPYKWFIGGRVGSGLQPVSWIHIEDVVGLMIHCMENPDIRGAVNFTTPIPITMEELGKNIGETLKRPHWLPVPQAALKLLMGEMACLLLEGQKVYPQQAMETGYTFKYPNINLALRDLLLK